MDVDGFPNHENSELSNSKSDCLGRTRVRRSSIRNSSEKKKCWDDQKPAAKIPPPNRRNGVKVLSTQHHDTEQEENDNMVLETCAVSLASLDRRACARVQMRDANGVLEQLLLPISFPWSQSKDILYKPLPRDIDEMSVLMNVDEDHSIMELNSETFRSLNAVKMPKSIPISTTETDDSGIVELRVYAKPTASRSKRLQRAYSVRLHDEESEDPVIAGELSLQMYHEVQSKKRRREEFELANTSKKHISFRVGGTSSRSTIFSPSELSHNPLFLQATYPKQIQDGVKRFGLDAYEEGVYFGSYNGRMLPTKDSVVTDPTSKNRFIVGRTRLVWSEKEQSESKSIRTPYCSILSRQRLEPNALKRPLSVKVGIRINGVLVVHGAKLTNGSAVAAHEPSYSYSTKTVNDALDAACRIEEKLVTLVITDSNKSTLPHDYSQCSLNVPNFVKEVARINKSCLQQHRGSMNAIDQIRVPIAIFRQLTLYQSDFIGKQAQGYIYRVNDIDEADESIHTELFRNGQKFVCPSKLKLRLNIVPPRFDCLPTEDGIIQVTCTMPGQILLHTDEILNLTSTSRAEIRETSLLVSILANEINRCPECWNYKDDVTNCNTCKNSCRTILPQNDSSKWIHITGSPWSKLDAMVTADMYASNQQSTSYDTKTREWYNDKSCCHICNKGTMGPVTVSSCSAEGCDVRFHPICAILTSAANEVQYRNGVNCSTASSHESNGNYEKSTNQLNYEDDDTYLCTQYTQSLMKMSFTKAGSTAITTYGPKMKTTKPQQQSRCGIAATARSNNRTKVKNGTYSNGSTTTTATKRKVTRKAAVAVELPIMFCPYHNPKRWNDYYGFYPLGGCFNHDTIRIPAQRCCDEATATTAASGMK